MKHSKITAVLALGAFIFTAACGDDDDSSTGTSVQSLCERGCSTTASLSCPNDTPSTCVSECVEGYADSPQECRQAMTSALECIANRPASDWECDDDGDVSLKEGVCTQEAFALFGCLLEHAPEDDCPFENDGDCDDPTGTDLCPAGTDLADCSG